MSARNLLIIALIVLTQGACSLAFVKGAPVIRPGATAPATVDCTTENTIPALDIVTGVATAAIGVYMVARAEETDDDGFGTALGVANILGGTGQMAVGVSALSKVDACREFLATPVTPTPPDSAPALGPDGFRGALRPGDTEGPN